MPSSESQFFSASYDSTTKIISAAVFVIFVVAVIATKSAITAGVGGAVVIFAYAYSPRGYAIRERSIAVQRLIGNVHIPIEGAREIRTAAADDFRGCIRLWGSGGMFGYYGIFRTSKLGRSTWYVTNRSNAVVVITDAKTALFSPDDVHGFIRALRASGSVPQVTPGARYLDAMRSPGSGGLIGKLIGPAVGIVALAFAALALLYSPGPPSYSLTPDALTIHDRFYPVTVNAAAVDVEHIRIVDAGSDPDWRPTARTNGFANQHYKAGWFRVASGKTVRMYRADSLRLVLLPPKGDGAPVLLETQAPEKFVAEVRREWSRRNPD